MIRDRLGARLGHGAPQLVSTLAGVHIRLAAPEDAEAIRAIYTGR